MGEINSVTCKNPQCRYHAEVYSGPGFFLFRSQEKVKEGLLNGTIENPQALQYLKEGGVLCSVAAYLCPKCRELVTSKRLYMSIRVNSRSRKVVFPFGVPLCGACHTELTYIPNVRSSRVKCPKCGGPLQAELSAHYD